VNVRQLFKDRGLATEEQLAQAAAESENGESLVATLVSLGHVSETDALSTLAEAMGMPFVELADFKIDPAAIEGIPRRFIFQNDLVPVERSDGVIRVAIADPLNLTPLDELRLLIDVEVEAVVAPAEQIRQAIRRHFGVGAEQLDNMTDEQAEDVELLGEIREGATEGDLDLAADASLVNLVNQILIEALHGRASDVHMEPFEGTFRVRYRVDGVLQDAGADQQIKAFQSAIVSRIKIMSNLDVAEKRLPQDGRMLLRIEGREVDVRVSIIPNITGESVVLRLLERSSIRYSLTELGMGEDDLVVFSRFIARPHGIILVTGPTGSGKTTTLYAALSKINTIDRKIITVEEPVEYQLEGISQIQVRPEIGLTFARGLRHILRHDPDVVMVGEIRDPETAQIAIQSSLTGHLVFSTVHTNDAAGAVTRMIDMGIEPYLVASTVQGIQAQRLVRLICENCKVEVPADDVPPELGEGIQLERQFRGEGCSRCNNTGYYGRQGIFEVLPVTDPIRELIISHTASPAIKEAGRQAGMRTLREDGMRKVEAGVTTIDEVMRVAIQDES